MLESSNKLVFIYFIPEFLVFARTCVLFMSAGIFYEKKKKKTRSVFSVKQVLSFFCCRKNDD